jgi:hypothetical protein
MWPMTWPRISTRPAARSGRLEGRHRARACRMRGSRPLRRGASTVPNRGQGRDDRVGERPEGSARGERAVRGAGEAAQGEGEADDRDTPPPPPTGRARTPPPLPTSSAVGALRQGPHSGTRLYPGGLRRGDGRAPSKAAARPAPPTTMPAPALSGAEFRFGSVVAMVLANAAGLECQDAGKDTASRQSAGREAQICQRFAIRYVLSSDMTSHELRARGSHQRGPFRGPLGVGLR